MSVIIRMATMVLAVTALAGCTLANLTSIHREFDLGSGKSQIIDAKQRAVYVSVPEDGSPVRVCSEPSPDALTLLAASGDLSASNANRTSIGGSASVAESGGSIGLRTAGIQQLRDMTFRLCEAYLSGAIDGNSYDLQLRRYQNQLVVLLAIEQLTGAVTGPSLAVLNATSAGPAGTAKAFLAERNALKEEKNQLDTILADSSSSQAQKEDATKRLGIVKSDLTFYEGALSNLQATGGVVGGVAAGVSAAPQRPAAGDIDKVSSTVEAMVTELLKTDYSLQLCFQYSLSPPNNVYERQNVLNMDLENYCRYLFSAHAVSSGGAVIDLEKAAVLMSDCYIEITSNRGASRRSMPKCEAFRKSSYFSASTSSNGAPPAAVPGGSSPGPFKLAPEFRF